MNERGGCNLLVERVLWIPYPKTSPDLRHLFVEGQNRLCISHRDLVEPPFETLRLSIISSMSDALDAQL
jgi:hypothetical protein